MIEFMPGMATQDDDWPAAEFYAGITFVNDGILHICGWNAPLPSDFSDSTLRLIFFVGAAGSAKCTLTWAAGRDSGTILNSGAVVFDVSGLGFVSIDVDISGWLGSSVTTLLFSLARNSLDPLDTLAGDLAYMHGRSLT